jgi:hypothetical protein
VNLTLDACTGFLNEVPRETRSVTIHPKIIARAPK